MTRKARWEADHGILSLRFEDNRIYVPSAQEIFAFIFGKAQKIHGVLPENDPESLLGGLEFSKYPIEPVVELRPSADKLGVFISIKVENEGLSVEVDDFFDRISDHMIVRNIWYPFMKGSLADLKAQLGNLGIVQPGEITLKSYLLVRMMSDYTVRDFTSDQINARHLSTTQAISKKTNLFQGNLYNYQRDGYCWLAYIDRQDMGCILADEMGLGKTIQVIALLCDHINDKQPSLIVAPATLLENWNREIARFAPRLTTAIHQGSSRTGFASDLVSYNAIITSYETVTRDKYMLKEIGWNLLILDEAQAIKNPMAKRTRAVKILPRRNAIAMTGTPVQNNLVDLWSISDFVLPGMLGTLRQFEGKYATDIASAKLVEPLISPIMLRRMVDEVAQDLPEKISIDLPLSLDEKGSQEYEEIRNEVLSEYMNGATLAALTKLRMYCCHPSLLIERPGDPTEYSTKYIRLLEVLDEIFANKEKALIFTSWKKMIDLLTRDIAQRFHVHTQMIDGRVSITDRQNIVDEFNRQPGPGILVLNPGAGGTGLNITGANHVIHYNLEWNPAIVDQATARAYRRGQKRPVTVHRFYYLDTVEEVIIERLSHKKQIAETAVVGVRGKDEDLQYILSALQRSPTRPKNQ